MVQSSQKVQISIRLPANLYEALGTIAEAAERDRTWVILRALKQYMQEEGAELLEVAAGVAALDRGEGVDFDEVVTEAEEIIAQAEAKRALAKAG